MPSSDRDRWIRNVRDLVKEPDPGSGAPGTTGLERFEILGPLGEGAAGVVHRARDRQLGREVALKILRDPIGADATVRDRFRREAAVAAKLSHPNVVAVHDAGETEGRPFLVMELIDGRPLSAVLHDDARTLEEVLRIVEKAARGVEAVHRQGIVHRDLKPANILVTRDGEPKVGDFGLAHIAGSEAALTRTGTIMGTPLYMAPEQVRGNTREISRRTDVYALGAILYEAVAGRPPHTGDNVTEIYAKITSEDPASPRRMNRAVARDLETIILKALEKEPDRRYPTAEAFAEDLRRHLAGEPIEARPSSAAARLWRRAVRHRKVVVPFAALLLLAGGLGAWGLVSGEQRDQAERRTRALKCVQRGQELYGRGDPDGAIAKYDEAVALDPINPEGTGFRGVVHMSMGNQAAAIADFSESIRLDPADTRPWTNRGVARFRAGDFENAGRDFAKAIELDPQNPWAFYNRGVLRKDLGKNADAAADLEETIRLAAPGFPALANAKKFLQELRRKLHQ